MTPAAGNQSAGRPLSARAIVRREYVAAQPQPEHRPYCYQVGRLRTRRTRSARGKQHPRSIALTIANGARSLAVSNGARYGVHRPRHQSNVLARCRHRRCVWQRIVDSGRRLSVHSGRTMSANQSVPLPPRRSLRGHLRLRRRLRRSRIGTNQDRLRRQTGGRSPRHPAPFRLARDDTRR